MTNTDKLFAVIMAGGKGERLWPLSTEQRPKPLIPLDGDLTLLEGTVQRLFPLLLPDHIFVIADEYSAPAIRSLLTIPPENVIAEPCRRNTAPCVALATALVKRKSPDAVIIMLPADHLISPVTEFQDDLKRAIETALEDHLVTLGDILTCRAELTSRNGSHLFGEGLVGSLPTAVGVYHQKRATAGALGGDPLGLPILPEEAHPLEGGGVTVIMAAVMTAGMEVEGGVVAGVFQGDL